MTARRLASEPSSYLRTAAHQPVDWHPWGAEAFERAKREDKPILLDIGAVWCHWCHVMDGESYENEETARIINDSFVAIKVDRDERPDVDARYQLAIQAMIGQGGWPLTGFLLPDGRPFYGGTYFPPIDAHGRPAFKRVLVSVAESYRDRRDEAISNADSLTRHLEKRNATPAAAGEVDLEKLFDASVAHMQQAFDPENGGFGRAPKFPHPAAHDFLLARALGTGRGHADATARDIVGATLDAMRDGGMYDHLAGGFHRYSVDAHWGVPHFEKMIYDNAGLLRNYVRASRLPGRSTDARTAAEVVTFIRDVLGAGSPGFGGSQDADVGMEDDGDFFTWSLDELAAAIPDEKLARWMGEHYGIRARGPMHHDPTRNVLRIEADAEALAAAHHITVTEMRAALLAGKRLMQAARAKRTAPFVDPIRYANWNGMTIEALLEYGGHFGDAHVDRLALDALDLFLAEAYDHARGFARSPGSRTFGLLDDNAQMLAALVEAHFATGDARYVDAARHVADLLISDFAHPDGAFADRAERIAPAPEGEPLRAAQRPLQDAPTASPNGVALGALLRLADATGERRYADVARGALERLAPEAARMSLFGGALLLALERMHDGAPRIVVPHGAVGPFRVAARRAAPPGATLVGAEPPGLPDEARAYAGPGALVCVGTRCLAPAESPAELESRLRSLHSAL